MINRFRHFTEDFLSKPLCKGTRGKWRLRKEFRQKTKNKYGIEFPAWHHTGNPSTNRGIGDPDIDIWIYPRRPWGKGVESRIYPRKEVPPKFAEDLQDLFDPKNRSPIDNYNKYYNWRDRRPVGGVTFSTNGRITRKESPWDRFSKLSPEGKQEFLNYYGLDKWPE